MSEQLVILGAGGHARVLIAALTSRGMAAMGCLSPRAPGPGWPPDVAHLGGDDYLDSLSSSRTRLVNGVGSTGPVSARRTVFLSAKDKGYAFAAVLHRDAIVAADAVLGEGVQVMAGAVVQTGVTLAANVLVNTGAVIDHDCSIGAHSHIATGALLSGGVSVGDEVHVGTGAVIIQGVSIGAGAIIGAGAVVIADVPAATTVVGNPARAPCKPAQTRQTGA